MTKKHWPDNEMNINFCERMVSDVVDKIPCAALLVGSMARGHYDEASDIDITIVIRDNDYSKVLDINRSLESVLRTNSGVIVTHEKEVVHKRKVTVKVFTVSKIREFYRDEFVIMVYIFSAALMFKDDIDFHRFVEEERSRFEIVALELGRQEIARARNAIYWMSLNSSRRYSKIAIVSLAMDAFERLIRAWYLLSKEPYPYRKWIFSGVVSRPELATEISNMEEILESIMSDGGDHMSRVKNFYESYIRKMEVSTGRPIINEFEYESTEYYALLDR